MLIFNSMVLHQRKSCDGMTKRTVQELLRQGFPGGAVVESLPANAGNMGLSPSLGRSHMPWSN